MEQNYSMDETILAIYFSEYTVSRDSHIKCWDAFHPSSNFIGSFLIANQIPTLDAILSPIVKAATIKNNINQTA